MKYYLTKIKHKEKDHLSISDPYNNLYKANELFNYDFKTDFFKIHIKIIIISGF